MAGTKWQHPEAHYFTVKLKNGKWSVLEKNPDGTRDYLGEYDTQNEALNKENELENQGNALRRIGKANTERITDSDIQRDKEKNRRFDETVERMETQERSKSRLAQRKAEYEHYKTRHQKRRDERM